MRKMIYISSPDKQALGGAGYLEESPADWLDFFLPQLSRLVLFLLTLLISWNEFLEISNESQMDAYLADSEAERGTQLKSRNWK